MAVVWNFRLPGCPRYPRSQGELTALTELVWIVSELRPVNLELSGHELDPAGIEMGVSIMRHFFLPYLSSKYKQP